MKIYQKALFFFVILILSVFIPQIVRAAIVQLGGLDLDSYCRSTGQGGATLANNSWSCQSGATINMATVCQTQYRDQGATASQEVAGNPYTWSCFRDDQISPTPIPNPTTTPSVSVRPTPTPTIAPTPTSTVQQVLLGGMDLDGYCRSQNLPGAVVASGIWRCGASGTVISLTAACQWQYVASAVARQDVAGNPYTWSCYSAGGNATLTPTTTPTPTPTPTPSSVTPTPSMSITPTIAPAGLRVRRSIYSLTPDEVSRLVNAINTLRANGTYREFMNRHIQAMMAETPANDPTTDRNVAHRGPAFLSWHRAFIYEFEEQLRAVDPTVTLPYWPFEQETGTPRVFTSAYFGSDGNDAQNDRVTDGPFASWNVIRRIARDQDTGQTSLPSVADVNTIMQNTAYSTAPYSEQSAGFVMSMEGWIGTARSPWSMHNLVHGYVGGDMGTMDSANDPIFFLVHANIDRIWWQWEQQRGITNYQPVSGGPTGHNVNDTLRFLLRTPTSANVLDIQNDMGYTYN